MLCAARVCYESTNGLTVDAHCQYEEGHWGPHQSATFNHVYTWSKPGEVSRATRSI